MAWIKVDDKLRSHPKWLQLASHPDAKLLWFECLVGCNEQLTDGRVHSYVIETWAFQAGLRSTAKRNAAIKALVQVGLWHDHETILDCEECLDDAGAIDPGSYYVHQYLEHQPNRDEVKDPLEKRRGRRRKQLHRNLELCVAVRARDHDRCRYCGIDVNFKARTGDQSGTYAHINPNDFGSSAEGDNDGGNALHKLVVACRRCNGIKKNRTPDEAHMPLLPVPAGYDPATGEVLAAPAPVLPPGQDCPDPNPDLAQDSPGPGQETARKSSGSPGPGQDPRAHAREAGPGQDGPGPGQDGARNGPGRARTATGRTGAARTRGGPGRAGGGPGRSTDRDGPGRGGSPPSPSPPPARTTAESSTAEDAR